MWGICAADLGCNLTTDVTYFRQIKSLQMGAGALKTSVSCPKYSTNHLHICCHLGWYIVNVHQVLWAKILVWEIFMLSQRSVGHILQGDLWNTPVWVISSRKILCPAYPYKCMCIFVTGYISFTTNAFPWPWPCPFDASNLCRNLSFFLKDFCEDLSSLSRMRFHRVGRIRRKTHFSAWYLGFDKKKTLVWVISKTSKNYVLFCNIIQKADTFGDVHTVSLQCF